jgi:glutathione S-transferase
MSLYNCPPSGNCHKVRLFAALSVSGNEIQHDPTLAECAAYPCFALALEGGIASGSYPAARRWLAGRESPTGLRHGGCRARQPGRRVN